MGKNRHTPLVDCDRAPFVLKGLRSPSIIEPPIPVTIAGKAAGNFQALEVFERIYATAAHPQLVADIISNAYFRLSYQKTDGTSATFGTSVVGAPSFRSANGKLHLIPACKEATLTLGDPHRLKISVTAQYGEFARLSSVRTYATQPDIFRTAMKLEISFNALRDIELEKTRRGQDVFRLFTISSMFSSEVRYDGNLIRWERGDTAKELRLTDRLGRARYLLGPDCQAENLSVLKTSGSKSAIHTPGSPDSPSIHARLISSSVPGAEIVAQAFLADTRSINDDSLSVWLEWAGCPEVIRAGTEIAAAIDFSATEPE